MRGLGYISCHVVYFHHQQKTNPFLSLDFYAVEGEKEREILFIAVFCPERAACIKVNYHHNHVHFCLRTLYLLYTER